MTLASAPGSGLPMRGGSDPPSITLVIPVESRPVRIFVAMSFRDEQEPALVDYWQAMLRAAKRAKREFEFRRIDELEGDYDVVEAIYREIDQADIMIADLTLCPANVYLEIGYARGRRKPVIQTCRDDTLLEFDLRGRRTLIYRNATDLENKLLRVLDSI
jgi:nucleoside 2-deoxyribosyltransferase